MVEASKTTDNLVWFLSERAKELNCLYKIEEILNRPDTTLAEICRGVVEAIPPGWQFPDICLARIALEGVTSQSPDFRETPWVQHADITVQEKTVGRLSVFYTAEMPQAGDGPFLKEETKLLGTIAERLAHYILYTRMKAAFREFQTARQDLATRRTDEWRIALNFLRRTNRNLYFNISRRMLNFLHWSGIAEAERLLQNSLAAPAGGTDREPAGDNRPSAFAPPPFSEELSDETFHLAARHLSSEQILANIQKWIQEDRLSFLVQVANRNLALGEVVDAVRRYHHIVAEGISLPPASKRGVLVSLIRRFLSHQPEFIRPAVEHLEIDDFHEILDHIIYSPESQGKLGGKSAGLFLAKHVLRRAAASLGAFAEVKVPKTWYIASDGLLSFLAENNLNEVIEQKYKDLNQVRLEYPHIIQSFKSSRFPTEIIQGLSMVLDDFRDRPIIVRSSSLLEDRAGASFSGKYKSLFLANRGRKQDRLKALEGAIAEIYASTFGPDPIGYRAERNLIDFAEEMGIMIQEVVGTQVGGLFFPSFAGVAFSLNEFRWSPRNKREDGLLRLVPGLGTRAVDRTSDDYPVLVAPGQVSLRVNVAPDEIVRYAPKNVDVISLKDDGFATIAVKDWLASGGPDIPAMANIVSVFDGQALRRPLGKSVDFQADDLVVTFEGLIHQTSFIPMLRQVMSVLEDAFRSPIDIEFASDGRHFYLLQCRPQAAAGGRSPAEIPRGLPAERVLFRADRFVSNGVVPDISHVVYVDPDGYDRLSSQSALLSVARAVGRLNKILPRRRFILMGPGRWGSRGNIKLGVQVTYSDISNTAMLIEMARRKGDYLPDLSFGTHFFQDLVEADIRYLPLYPDEPSAVFQENFFRSRPNIVAQVLPEFEALAEVVRVIDVPQVTGGQVLRILMNAEADQAVGFLTDSPAESPPSLERRDPAVSSSDYHWAWRHEIAERIASWTDPSKFGLEAMYLIGSVKNARAGPESDIDLLFHFRGTAEQRRDLLLWLEAWSLCLEEMNFQKTGVRREGLLDIHIVTDEDIVRKTSYAVKIGAVTDAARPLPMGGALPPRR